MFWSFKKSTGYITVVFSDQAIIIAQIQDRKIKLLDKIEIDNSEIINLKLFNQSKAYRFIKDFIDKQKLKNYDIIFILHVNLNSIISEMILNQDDYFNQIERENIKYDLDKLKFSTLNIGDLIYCAGIPYYILFQYQLLAINLKVKLISIVTDTACLSNLLKPEEIENLNLSFLKKTTNINNFKDKLGQIINKLNFENIKYLGPKIDNYTIAQILGTTHIFLI